MTERTTPITVYLTDEQMDAIEQSWDRGSISHQAVLEAVKAQRPRPIAVGDRVYMNGIDHIVYEVKAIDGTWAWLFFEGKPSTSWPHAPLYDLTRVDDEDQP